MFKTKDIDMGVIYNWWLELVLFIRFKRHFHGSILAQTSLLCDNCLILFCIFKFIRDFWDTMYLWHAYLSRKAIRKIFQLCYSSECDKKILWYFMRCAWIKLHPIRTLKLYMKSTRNLTLTQQNYTLIRDRIRNKKEN